MRPPFKHIGRDPLRLDGSGRQHRPAELIYDALRCVEVENEFVAPGPGHERELSLGCFATEVVSLEVPRP